MGKGNANLDLRLEKTSDTPCGSGANVAGCSGAGKGAGHHVNIQTGTLSSTSFCPLQSDWQGLL